MGKKMIINIVSNLFAQWTLHGAKGQQMFPVSNGCEKICILYYFLSYLINVSQKLGKERKNSYRKMKRSPEERHTQTYLIYFDDHKCLSQSEESK